MSLNKYTTYIKGNYPIILCSPHGGLINVKPIPTRDNHIPCKKLNNKCHENFLSFVTQNDGPMTEIAHYIFANISSLTCKMPYLIVNNVERKDIDINREKNIGAETNLAKQIWDDYYNTIDSAIQDAFKKFGKKNVILIDLHSYGKRPTNNRNIICLGYGLKTHTLIKKKYSNDDLKKFSLKKISTNINKFLYGEKSLGNFISNQDLNVFPSPKFNKIKNINNFLNYSGGHCIKKYRDIIPCIQIELPEHYIKRNNIYEVSKKLASSIVLFLYSINNIPFKC